MLGCTTARHGSVPHAAQRACTPARGDCKAATAAIEASTILYILYLSSHNTPVHGTRMLGTGWDNTLPS